MAITPVADMVARATAPIRTISVGDALALQQDPGVQFVDIRDIRELAREGRLPNALHAPRGMLEFWVDPASPYHRDIFASGRLFVFFCAMGWRAALATATLQDMGLTPVASLEGGFNAWRKAGGPVLEPDKAAP